MTDPDTFHLQHFLEQTGLDEESFQEIAETFLLDIPLQIADLETAIRNQDLALIRRLAHTIKGAAANLAAGNLHRTALQIEKAAGTVNMESLNQSLLELKEHFQELRSALETKGRET